MEQQKIDSEAAEWLVRLEDVERPVDAAEQQAWMAWLKRSPKHVEAYFNVATVSESIDEVSAEGRARVREMLAKHREAFVPNAQREWPRGRMRPTGRIWFAAAAFIACLVAGMLWLTFHHSHYEAGVGQQASYRLPDGSSMVLNTRSQAKVSMNDSERVVELEGEGLFVVAAEPSRPFKVRTRNAVVQAVGTQFNVYEHGTDATRISVIEGTVKISALSTPSSEPFLVSAGQEAEVARRQIARALSPKVSSAVAWRKKTLIFEDVPLAEVAKEFNRYNRTQFVLSPDVGERQRLSGTFDPLRPEYFRAYLERDDALRVTEQEGVVRVNRR